MTLLGRLATRMFPLGVKRGEGPLVLIARRHAWSTPLVVLLGTVASFLEGTGIGLLIPLMSELMGGAMPRALPGPIRELVVLVEPFALEIRILIIGVAIIALIAFKGIVQLANAALVAWIDTRVSHQVRTALAKKVLTLDYPFFLVHDQARLVKINITDTWYGLEVVRCGFQLLTGMAAVTVFGALMLWLDWRLSLTVVIGIIVIRMLQNWLEGRVSHLGGIVTRENETLAERMLAVVGAYRPIRIFQQEDNELARFAQASDRVRRDTELIERWSALARPLVEVLMAVLFVALIVFSHRTGWSIAMVPTFLILLYRTQPQLALINSARLRIAAVQGSLREVEWLLSQAGPARLEKPVKALPAIDLSIHFELSDLYLSQRHGRSDERDTRDSARHRYGAYRPIGSRQVNCSQPPVPAAGTTSRHASPWRDAACRHRARQLARAHSLGRTGRRLSRGDGRLQHRLQPSRRQSRGDRRCSSRGQRARIHLGASRGLPNVGGRRWPAPLRRPASAHRSRPGTATPSRPPDSRRGDERSRCDLGK